MKKLLTICAVVGLILVYSSVAKAIDPTALSNSLAGQLKANQVDCDGDTTKELCHDTWKSGPNPTGWDEYSLVINANVMAGLKLHGDTTEADNAVNYFFVTNKNWAKKTQEEAIVGAGGSAFYADSSYTGEDSWGKAWGFHGQDYSNTGRNSSPEGMDNMAIGLGNLAIAGYYAEAVLCADAIIGQTDTTKPWSNNRQYWDTDHLAFPDSDWQATDEIELTVNLKWALQVITDSGTKDYSTTITAIDAWHGGYGTSWDEAIDYYYEPETYQYDDHYDDVFKLLADWDAASAQNLADNIDLNNPYFSYAISNVWAINAMVANGQVDFAGTMTEALVDKYWDGSDVTGTYPNRCRGALLMANEIAPVPEPTTLGLLLVGGLVLLRRRHAELD